MTDGVIYIAFGEKYVREVLYSAGTVKKFTGLPVTLFTDRDITSPHLDTVRIIDPAHKRAKVDFISETPYDRTLYLDSDTQVANDISDVFGILDRFDVAAVHDHSRKSPGWANHIPEYEAIPYAFPEFNGGVLLFRNSENVQRFLELWRFYFYRDREKTNGQDQPSLRISLWESRVLLHSLPVEYNVRNMGVVNRLQKAGRQSSHLKPRIYHWHGTGRSTWLQNFRAKYRPMRY